MKLLGPNFFVLLCLGLSLLLAAIDQTVVSIAMPAIAAELNGFGYYTWISASYLAASTLFLPLGGLISDRWGRKRTMSTGLLLFIAASVWCGAVGHMPFLSGIWELICARLLQGAGAGVILSSVFIIVADMYSPAERGRYQGLFAAVWALASLAGPIAGGWLTEYHNWRWVFLVNIPVGLSALFLLVPARVFEIGDVWRHPYNAKEIFAFFCNSTVVISMVSALVTGAGMYGAVVLLPLFFQIVMGIGPQKSGELLTPLVLVTCAFSVVGGMYLAHAKRYKKLLLAGLLLMAAGTFALSTISLTTGQETVLISMMVAGAGLGLLLPAYTIIIQNVMPEEVLGLSTGISQLARSIGGVVGTVLLGALLIYLWQQNLGPTVFARPEFQLVFPDMSSGAGSVLTTRSAANIQAFIGAMDTVFTSYGIMLVVTFVLNLVLKETTLRSKSELLPVSSAKAVQNSIIM